MAALDEVVFYDGDCGLCHGFVRFVLARDSRGAFKFAQLQSATFRARVTRDVPDTVVVATAGGQVLVRSAAVFHVLERLGGTWAVGARLGAVVPAPLRDAVYDGVAAVRHRLFARPAEACPVMPRELRARFLT